MLKRPHTIGALLIALLLIPGQGLRGQVLAPRLESWRPPVAFTTTAPQRILPDVLTSSETHSHTLTGLLIGGLIGAAATGVFLAAFCSDPDTQCGADEVGRAVLIIGVPPAVVGAVVGSLIRTKS